MGNKMLKEEVVIPDNVEGTIKGNVLSINGPKGTVSKKFQHSRVFMDISGKKIIISYIPLNKKITAIANTWKMHINNMCTGVVKGWRYRMKTVYAHFPVKLTVKDGLLYIENFLGEKLPRTAKIIDGVNVKIADTEIIVEGIDIEKVGIMASRIEKNTKIWEYDSRVFQDGIYIISKGEYM